jgi:hypothetical protein
MENDDYSHVDPVSLADLMDCRGQREELWSQEELQAILKHQLAAEVQFDLERFDEAVGRDLPRAQRSVEGLSISSFGDLFQHPQPPIELLDLTRRWAKACRTGSDHSLPAEIATILYLSSIAAAMTRCHCRISALGDEALRYGFDWALAQQWLDESTLRLLESGRRALDSTGP